MTTAARTAKPVPDRRAREANRSPGGFQRTVRTGDEIPPEAIPVQVLERQIGTDLLVLPKERANVGCREKLLDLSPKKGHHLGT